MTTPTTSGADVLLTDAEISRVRPVRPGDAPALRALHERVSAHTLYLRFFTASRGSVEAEVDRLTRRDDGRHAVLVAELHGRLVAVAGYEVLEDPTTAEVAFLVDDEHHELGLGTVLLEHLAATARDHGITRFVAETLPENASMLGVFRAAGLPVTVRSTLDSVEVDIGLVEDDRYLAAVGRRESLATAVSLSRILRPRSVAVVGAGRAAEGIGHRIVANIVAGGFRGTVAAVNRAGVGVRGCPGYRALGDVPGPLDLVVAAVPAAEVLAVAHAAAVIGAAGIAVISAGFADAGPAGRAAQHELVEICRAADMRLIGPNCMGVANAATGVRLNATFAPSLPPSGGIGLMSQSGAVGIAGLAYAARTGVGLSSFVSAGNKADISGNDLLGYWEHDDRTKVCALYLESFGNPRKFARIAARVARRKPIVAVKAGRSVAGARGVTLHTAAAAAPDVAVDGLFEQAGVIRVDTLAELFEVASVLDRAPLPRGGNVAVLTNSGGAGVLLADACEAAGLALPPLGPETMARLGAVTPQGSALGNPVDLLATADAGAFDAALQVLLDASEVDGVIAVVTTVDDDSADAVAHVIRRAAADHPERPLVTVFLGCTSGPAALRDGDGISCVPVFAFPEQAARALGAAVRYARWRARPAGTVPMLADIDRTSARTLVARVLAGEPTGCRLDPTTTSQLLASYGIPVPTHRHASSRDAIDMAVGVVTDELFGPLVVVGVGGLESELLADHAYRLLPMTVEDAGAAIRSLRAAPLLFGYGGRDPAAAGAVEDLVLRVAALASDIPEVDAVDLNPVVVTSTGVAVADASISVVPRRPSHPLLRRLTA